MFTKNDFNSLVRFLREKGYDVKVKADSGLSDKKIKGYSAYVFGKGIRGGFSWLKDKNDDYYYRYVRDSFAVDNAECFDKYSKCPMVLKLPADYGYILNCLKIMGTEWAYELSNTFEKVPGIPYDIQNGWFS